MTIQIFFFVLLWICVKPFISEKIMCVLFLNCRFHLKSKKNYIVCAQISCVTEHMEDLFKKTFFDFYLICVITTKIASSAHPRRASASIFHRKKLQTKICSAGPSPSNQSNSFNFDACVFFKLLCCFFHLSLFFPKLFSLFSKKKREDYCWYHVLIFTIF